MTATTRPARTYRKGLVAWASVVARVLFGRQGAAMTGCRATAAAGSCTIEP
jgi:hypothetical protein